VEVVSSFVLCCRDLGRDLAFLCAFELGNGWWDVAICSQVSNDKRRDKSRSVRPQHGQEDIERKKSDVQKGLASVNNRASALAPQS
jgi:hypothetical protein